MTGAEGGVVPEIAPGVPIEFAEPRLAALTWERDAVHMPRALTPLAADYALVLGNSLNQQFPMVHEALPQRWHAATWHGYVYYAFERNASDTEWAAIEARSERLRTERALVTQAYFDDEVIPELRAIYARLDGIDAERLPGPALAEAWAAAWRDAERAWELHMDVTPPVFGTRAALADAYATAVPGAPRGEADRLLRGSSNELVEFDVATEALAELASSMPAVRDALRAAAPSMRGLEAVEGGQAFVDAVAAVLATHGHLGQLADDLAMPSFGELPDLYLAEVAKRMDGRRGRAEDRRLQLLREADELAERARHGLSGEPDALARFERVLALARAIGPISERHNYWIDRAALAHLRRLAMRVGTRLVREGVIAEPSDVFYLRRTEIAQLLREPESRYEVVGQRRAEHEADQRLQPASRLGAPAGPPSTDRPHFDSPQGASGDGRLTGTGASPGVVRGRARVVLDVHGFGRVQPGDIIVCYASNPSFIPILSIAGGLIATVGGILSHGAIVAREFGVPAVVGVAEATTRIPDGREVEIDGTLGTITLP